MDDLHWLRILREPGVLKTGSNMVDSFVKDPCNFNMIVVVSIHVRAKNSVIPCGVDAGHRPMRSTCGVDL